MEFFTSLAPLVAFGALLPSIVSLLRKIFASRAKNFTVKVVRADGTRVELNTANVEDAQEILHRLGALDSETENPSIEKEDR